GFSLRLQMNIPGENRPLWGLLWRVTTQLCCFLTGRFHYIGSPPGATPKNLLGEILEFFPGFVTGSAAPRTFKYRGPCLPFPRRRPMPVADTHPSIAELEAFTLGTLEDGVLARIEDHVAGCPICQERAGGIPGDSFVQLLCRVHAQEARSNSVAETGPEGSTP